MKAKTPISREIVDAMVGELGIRNLGEAKIREIVKLVNTIEEASGESYIRMEMAARTQMRLPGRAGRRGCTPLVFKKRCMTM